MRSAAAAGITIGGIAGSAVGRNQRNPRLELVGHSTLEAPDGGVTNMDVREDLGLAALGSFVLGNTMTHIADVSDPENPTLTASLSAGTGYVNDVFFHPEEPLVFTANEGLGDTDGGVGVIDVSDEDEPERLTQFEIEDSHGVHTIIGFDENYVIDSGTGNGISVLDVSDFVADPDTGEIEEVTRFQVRDHSVHDTQVRGDYAYLAHWNAGLYILDMSDPEEPGVAASFDYQEEEADVPLRNAHHAMPHPEDDICLVGEEVGTGDPGYKHVIEFDLETGRTELLSSFRPPQGNAQQPTGNQAFRWTGHFSDWGVGDQQDVLFSGDYKAGVQTFDLSAPENPDRIDQYMTTKGTNEVRSQGPARAIHDIPQVWSANTKNSEYVYVSDYNTGLFIFTLEGY